MDEKILERIEEIVEWPIDRLRRQAASGIEGRYSPSDARHELGRDWHTRGALIRIILEREFVREEV